MQCTLCINVVTQPIFCLTSNCSVNIAKKLLEDSFAMCFAFNTMVALMFQALLTVAVISKSGFELKAREQFVVYGGYFIALAVVYGITSVVSCTKRM